MTDYHPRSLYEATLEIDYEVRLQQLQARLYSRLHSTALMATFIASSAAFVSIIGGSATLAAVAGLAITIFGYSDALLDFAGRAAKHEAQRQRYVELRSVSDGMLLQDLDRHRFAISKTDPPEVESLRVPAYNDTVRAHGRDDYAKALNVIQKFVAVIA